MSRQRQSAEPAVTREPSSASWQSAARTVSMAMWTASLLYDLYHRYGTCEMCGVFSVPSRVCMIDCMHTTLSVGHWH